MKNVEFSVKIYDNTIEIIPLEPIKDNSLYEITISDVKAWLNNKHIDEVKTKVYTKMSPAYCSLESVESLTESVEVPDDRTLYYIKEASRYAEYIADSKFDEDDVPFNVSQFVRFRAAHDVLLKLYIERASEAGQRGQMGEIQFEVKDTKSLKDLLEYLKGEADKWEEKVKSEDHKKGAAPKAAIRSNPGYYSTSLSGFDRGAFR